MDISECPVQFPGFGQKLADLQEDLHLTRDEVLILAMLEEFLRTYEIERYLPRAGDKVNRLLMKVMKTTKTCDAAQDSRVAACLQAGFRYGQKVLRPSSVAIWEYERPKQPRTTHSS